MRRAAAPKPHKRAGVWYLVRRVPAEFEPYDRRRPVRISTEIHVADDPRAVRAAPMVARLNAELEAYWRGLRDGNDLAARERLKAAQKRARQLGLSYQTVGELAAGPIDEILRRVQILIDRNALDDETEVAAVAGGEQRPSLRLSELVQTVEDIRSVALADMSEKQLHRWRLPKKKAVANFREVLGEDKELVRLTREDGIKFRMWLQARVLTEGIDVGTANRCPRWESMKVSPVLARSRVVPITEAMACAASGGTALPMRSRHAESDCPSRAKSSSGSTRFCSAASSSVVNGRCQVSSRARITHTSRSFAAGSNGLTPSVKLSGMLDTSRPSATDQGPRSCLAKPVTARLVWSIRTTPQWASV